MARNFAKSPLTPTYRVNVDASVLIARGLFFRVVVQPAQGDGCRRAIDRVYAACGRVPGAHTNARTDGAIMISLAQDGRSTH
jgi:hypothetical protein